MGNQVSKPVGEPADDEYLKDSLDASHTKIKYSVEVLMDSDLDYQNVECNPANSSLSFHPAETSSPINKTPYEKAPKKIDKQPKLRDCCCDEVSWNFWLEDSTVILNQFQSKVASSPAGKQPDVNKRSQSMPQIGNVNVPEMHVSKENHGVSDIPFIDSTNSDGLGMMILTITKQRSKQSLFQTRWVEIPPWPCWNHGRNTEFD